MVQRILLLVVSFILISIAIAIGLRFFGSNSAASNKDALVNDISYLAAGALKYRMRIGTMGGGGGVYTGYTIPNKFATNKDGTFSAVVKPQSILFTANSAYEYGTIQVSLDSTGTLRGFTYSDEFQ